MSIIVSTTNLYKTFGDFRAVDGMSFAVEEGKCYSLLGPNGAGKTTSMFCLYGLVEPDVHADTEINVMGYDPRHDEIAIKALTGIVPQENNLDRELNVKENLQIYARLHSIPSRIANQRIDEQLDFMELTEKAYVPVQALSGGMQRRLAFARALLNKPRLLILDEPTTGLDPQVRQNLWAKLRNLMKENVTILLTTHYMEEAYRLADYIYIVNSGKNVIEGNPQHLVQKNIEAFVLELKDPDLLEKLSDIPENVRVESADEGGYIYAEDVSLLQDLATRITTERHSVIIRESNLEDLFLKTTGRELNE